MITVKAIILTFLLLLLADTSFAGFMPKAFKAEYSQIKKSRFKRRVVKPTPVSISYAFPRNIRMHSKDKVQDVLYICNQSKTWIYTPPYNKKSKGKLRVGPSSKFCFSKIFDVLNKGLTSNKSYKVKKLKGEKFELVFSPRLVAELNYEKFELSFDQMPYNFKAIKVITLFKKKNDKKPTLTLIRNKIKFLSGISANTFRFKAPKNTEIIKMK
jgi:outer membrane lipoprotein-sorting protein